MRALGTGGHEVMPIQPAGARSPVRSQSGSSTMTGMTRAVLASYSANCG